MIGAMMLDTLAKELKAKLTGPNAGFDAVSTDTRNLRAGELFVALSGENFDGNEFVPEARRRGAAGAVVSRLSGEDLPQLLVADTGLALARIARMNRERSSARVLAITGSQGKTTVKEMLRAILSLEGECLATRANLNNTVGVPLTLLQLEARHRFAVIEMGANRAGEIAFSTAAAQPDIALVTNAAMAHTEGFGGLQGVVQAKGEIIEGLRPDGTLLLNAADPNVDQWRRRGAAFRLRQFSLREVSGQSEYHAVDIALNGSGQPAFALAGPHGRLDIRLQLLGEHNIANAVAAAAAAFEAGAGPDAVRRGLESVEPVPGRLCPVAGSGGLRIIDDSYNAGPGSFRAAIDLLAELPGPHMLVAGDMLELGDCAEAMHHEVGRYAASRGIERLWAAGDHCRQMTRGFGANGRHFPDRQELIGALPGSLEPDCVILVKGSRGSRMDEVVAALRNGGTG